MVLHIVASKQIFSTAFPPLSEPSHPMLRMAVDLDIILALSMVSSRPFRWRTVRRGFRVGLGGLGLLGGEEYSAWSPGKADAASRSTPESVQTLLFPHPSPWPAQPRGQLAAAAQHPAPGCQGWQPRRHAAPLRASPPQFIPSRYTVAALYLDHFSVLWHFGGFSNPSLLPPAFLRGGTAKRTSFWRELQAHLLSGCSIPGGPCQGLRSQAARTRQAVEAGGWGAGPLALEARSGHTHCARPG